MKQKILKIKSVKYLHDYKLQITFQDGTEKKVDFKNFLNSSTNPEIRAYLDQDKFKSFSIKDGELMWGDFDLLFPIQDLYDNTFSTLP